MVGQHGPEAPQRLGRNPHPELGNVALPVRADEVEPPAGAGRVTPGCEGVGEAAANPEGIVPASDLQGIETGQLLVEGPPGQRLRRLPEQRIRSRPDEKKLPGAATAPAALVDLAAEHPKEIRHALDLIQNDQPLGVQIKVPSRIREPGRIAGGSSRSR